MSPETLLPRTSFEGERRRGGCLDTDVVVRGSIQWIFFLRIVVEGREECVSKVLVLRNTTLLKLSFAHNVRGKRAQRVMAFGVAAPRDIHADY